MFYPNSIYLKTKIILSTILPRYFNRNKKYFTEGNWQSYRYFQEPYEDVLRTDLEFDIRD